VRGSRFEVVVSSAFLKSGAFDAQGIVTVPHVRLIRRLGLLATSQMQALEQGVRAWLGIGESI
jgi:mRNA interferase MazF